MSKASRVAWIGATTVAVGVSVAGIGGFALSRAIQTEPEFDGHFVDGAVSQIDAEDQRVCVTAQETICATLLDGDMPSIGARVRGWLVVVPPSDITASMSTSY